MSRVLRTALTVSLLCSLGCEKKPVEIHAEPAATAPSPSAPVSAAPEDAAPPTPAKVALLIETGTDIQGDLPPEVIKREIRSKFPQLRACYEKGVKRDPELKGTVNVKFVIDTIGAVTNLTSGGGTLKDKDVEDCVLGVYRTMSFRAPDKGKVKVTYPIDFQYEERTPGHGHGSGGSDLGTGTGMGYGGCPCGCDHSEGMIADLRKLGRDAALAELEESLHTIGEREDAGYITDRMVRHRLRLVAYGRELGRVGPGRFTTLPPVVPRASASLDGSTKVQAQLIFHGETKEIVKGKEKQLRAAFVLRLELANTSAAEVTLPTPTLKAKFPLPVSRWYVAGGDGDAWNGVLPAHTKKTVHVIGYAGEPIPPGTDVAATLELGALSLPLTARARAGWNQPD